MMSDAALKFTYGNDEVLFWLEDSGNPLHIDHWGLHTVTTDAGRGSALHLLSLHEEGTADFDSENKLHVQHSQIAELDSVGLQRLGLPPTAPFRLELRGGDLLSSPRFSFQALLFKPTGTQISKIKRQGAFIKNAGKTYTVLDPLYSILVGVEQFNAIAPENIDERYRVWGDLKEELPEDAVVDDRFKTMSIVRADSFSLDYTADHQLNPVLLSRKKIKDTDLLTDEPEIGVALSPAKQKDFEERFHGYPDANQRYAIAGKWFVILGENARKAMSVVRAYQDKSVSERRALLENPRSILKDHLGDSLTDEEVEAVFEETEEYKSNRIERLGFWNPKICAYVVKPENDWIPPPEERVLNVPLEGTVLEIEVGEVPRVIKQLESAKSEGKSHIEVDGQSVPVSIENIHRLKTLGRSKEKERGNGAVKEEIEDKKAEELVPIIIDNLDEVGYAPEGKQVVGASRGTPALINKDLYEHQFSGLYWLQSHWIIGNQGALLADDMGLGKTIQTLAFLAWVQEQYQSGISLRKPFLIVAPTGLLRNWEDEASMHLDDPGLGILTKMYGAGLKKISLLSHLDQFNELTESDWVLTTYESMRDKIAMFIGIEWGVVVFDEVQKIKNPTSRVTEMAKALDSDFTLTLTGTPVENQLRDLWSILDTASPGCLGSLQEFHKTYEKQSDEGASVILKLSNKVLEAGDPPIMLRRMKKGNLNDIPVKHEHVIKGLMSELQAKAYRAAVESVSELGAGRSGMLMALQSMRRISLLAAPVGVEGLTDENINQSARLAMTVNILDEIAGKGEKALVFVESKEVQELLIPYLQNRYRFKAPPKRINGSVSGVKRKQLVDEFQKSAGNGEFDLMILSPKAAGVGLTITAANHVIHLSRWWNPAVEDQCTDRAYRIGQEKDVHVYLPLALFPDNKDYSFDVNLHNLLERKRDLSRTVLAPAVASDKDLGGLFDDTFGY